MKRILAVLTLGFIIMSGFSVSADSTYKGVGPEEYKGQSLIMINPQPEEYKGQPLLRNLNPQPEEYNGQPLQRNFNN